MEEENRLRHEKEEQVLRDRKEFDGKKLEFISSLEEEIKKGLVGVSCSYLHILSRCEGNLVKGYFLSSYEYNSDFPFGEPVYSPVCCKKHLSKFALVDWEKGEFRYLERTYKIVSEVLP